jgi:hypothetical protein
MAIDPMLYQKLSGRSGDPYTRMGEALAKNAKHKQELDEMPKGVAGGFRTMRMPGMWAQFFLFFKNWRRSKGD